MYSNAVTEGAVKAKKQPRDQVQESATVASPSAAPIAQTEAGGDEVVVKKRYNGAS